jgi:hypothetical protein
MYGLGPVSLIVFCILLALRSKSYLRFNLNDRIGFGAIFDTKRVGLAHPFYLKDYSSSFKFFELYDGMSLAMKGEISI